MSKFTQRWFGIKTRRDKEIRYDSQLKFQIALREHGKKLFKANYCMFLCKDCRALEINDEVEAYYFVIYKDSIELAPSGKYTCSCGKRYTISFLDMQYEQELLSICTDNKIDMNKLSADQLVKVNNIINTPSADYYRTLPLDVLCPSFHGI